MSGFTAGSTQAKNPNKGDKLPCNDDPNGAVCGDSESLGILEQFQRLYAERLKRLDGDSEVNALVDILILLILVSVHGQMFIYDANLNLDRVTQKESIHSRIFHL